MTPMLRMVLISFAVMSAETDVRASLVGYCTYSTYTDFVYNSGECTVIPISLLILQLKHQCAHEPPASFTDHFTERWDA